MTIVLIGLALLVGVGAYVVRANRNSAIAGAAEWARLAPLPESARNVRVEAGGTIFTREFVIRFQASPEVVERWIASSPGPASAKRTVKGAVTTYAITPGGGAQFAEVRVDASAGEVVIRTYWS